MGVTVFRSSIAPYPMNKMDCSERNKDKKNKEGGEKRGGGTVAEGTWWGVPKKYWGVSRRAVEKFLADQPLYQMSCDRITQPLSKSILYHQSLMREYKLTPLIVQNEATESSPFRDRDKRKAGRGGRDGSGRNMGTWGGGRGKEKRGGGRYKEKTERCGEGGEGRKGMGRGAGGEGVASGPNDPFSTFHMSPLRGAVRSMVRTRIILATSSLHPSHPKPLNRPSPHFTPPQTSYPPPPTLHL